MNSVKSFVKFIETEVCTDKMEAIDKIRIKTYDEDINEIFDKWDNHIDKYKDYQVIMWIIKKEEGYSVLDLFVSSINNKSIDGGSNELNDELSKIKIRH